MNIEVKVRRRSRFIQHSPVEKGDENCSIIEKVTKRPAHCKNITFNLHWMKRNFITPLALFSLTQLLQSRVIWLSLSRATLWSWWSKFPNLSCRSGIWIQRWCPPRCRWGCPKSIWWPVLCRGHTTAGHSHLANNSSLEILLTQEYQIEMDHYEP